MFSDLVSTRYSTSEGTHNSAQCPKYYDSYNVIELPKDTVIIQALTVQHKFCFIYLLFIQPVLNILQHVSCVYVCCRFSHVRQGLVDRYHFRAENLYSEAINKVTPTKLHIYKNSSWLHSITSGHLCSVLTHQESHTEQ